MEFEFDFDMSSDERFVSLYDHTHRRLRRYSRIQFRLYGGNYVSVSDRAEEAVQEAYALAWEKREELFGAEDPVMHMFKLLKNRIWKLLREDEQWRKRIQRMSEYTPTEHNPDYHLKLELKEFLAEEEYKLLSRMYLEGYSYSEICEEQGVKKSTLAMRINRIKKRVRKDFQNSE